MRFLGGKWQKINLSTQNKWDNHPFSLCLRERLLRGHLGTSLLSYLGSSKSEKACGC
jgi:hypothetical protein